MSNALKQLKSREFVCPESREISAYIQTILAAHPHGDTEEHYVEYAASVPFYVESFWTAANEQSKVELIQPILTNIKTYFFEGQDFIPDHHGAAGLMDDAYMFYCSVDLLNDKWKESAGVPLVDIDLSVPLKMMAAQLGEEMATKIQTHVKTSMNGEAAAEQLKTAGKYLLGGLAAMFAANKLLKSGGPSMDDKWAELLNNRVDHGW